MIKYLAGGKLGDFIYSLSVIQEKYIQTGHRGILYLSNKGDHFTHGLEKAYNDTYDIVICQPYILSYKIYNGEEYDIDLTEWRECDYVSRSYPSTMDHYYSIQWGKHKWIHNIPIKNEWENKIVISTVHYRFPLSIQWSRFVGQDIVFMCFDRKDYYDFCQRTRLYPAYHQPHTLMEMCIMIQSCKQFVASFSAPLALAFALHTHCVIGEFGPNERFCADFEKALPNITISG